MKDISIYFTPVSSISKEEDALSAMTNVHDEAGFPELDKKGIALLYVPEFRNGNPGLHGKRDDSFREFFYRTYKGANWNVALYDLGNLLPGGSVDDTYFALNQVVSELVKKDIVPVVIGGSQDLTVAMYAGYENLEQMINVLSIDNRLDLGDPEKNISASGFVSQMLMRRPCYLFNYAVVGYQTPLVKSMEVELFEKLFFDTVRYGEFVGDFKIAEPHLRNCDVVSIDLQAIRSSDFRGALYQEPNGFSNQEMCQIARYAGISDKVTSFGLFNLFPEDLSMAASAQVAQMLWYFIDGYSNRVGDFPIGSKKHYTKFTVFLDEVGHDIVFYKSNKSERWWMEVPYPPKKGSSLERHHIVPCHKNEYDNCLKGEIPDLWWKTYQKLG